MSDLKDLVRFRKSFLVRPPVLAGVLAQSSRHRVRPDGVLGEGAVTAGPGLQGDRVDPEVLQ